MHLVPSCISSLHELLKWFNLSPPQTDSLSSFIWDQSDCRVLSFSLKRFPEKNSKSGFHIVCFYSGIISTVCLTGHLQKHSHPELLLHSLVLHDVLQVFPLLRHMMVLFVLQINFISESFMENAALHSPWCSLCKEFSSLYSWCIFK